MPERGEILGQLVEDGPFQGLETVITYKMGHLPLDHYPNWGGEHVQGVWGAETRLTEKRLKMHIIEPIEVPTTPLIEQTQPLAEGTPLFLPV